MVKTCMGDPTTRSFSRSRLQSFVDSLIDCMLQSLIDRFPFRRILRPVAIALSRRYPIPTIPRPVGTPQLAVRIHPIGAPGVWLESLSRRIPGDSTVDSATAPYVRRFIDFLSDSLVDACDGRHIGRFDDCVLD